MHKTIDPSVNPPVLRNEVTLPEPLRAGRFNNAGEEDPAGHLFIGMGSGICHVWAHFGKQLKAGQRGEMTFHQVPGAYVNTGNFTEWIAGPDGDSFHAGVRKSLGMPPGSKGGPLTSIGPDTLPMDLDEGVWDVEVEVYEKGPDAEPTMVYGVEKNHKMRNIKGDKWVVSSYTAPFQGGTFEHHGIWGYDPNTGKYHGGWVKTVQANQSLFEGEYDPAQRLLTWVGRTRNCFGETDATGKVIMVDEHRIIRYLDRSTKTMEVYQSLPGKSGEFVKRDFLTARRRTPQSEIGSTNVPSVGIGRLSLVALQRGWREARVIGRNTHDTGLQAAAGLVMLGPAWDQLYSSTLRLTKPGGEAPEQAC